MTAPSGEVPPSMQLDPIHVTMVGMHVVVPVAGTPRSVGHMKDNAKFATPSTLPVLTDSDLDGEGRNIPHSELETSAGLADVEHGKKNPKSS
ncbi:hypothetical protein SUGI_0694300 [Cryptomeria japonica]|nr:hypothetical protein SUGI_0694300 [Cryptomeria japonica]